MNKKISRVAAAALMGLPLMALAQADPADPAARAPALAYQSAFADYKPWQEIQPADWRAVNDTVRDAKPAGAAGSGAAGSGTAGSGAPK